MAICRCSRERALSRAAFGRRTIHRREAGPGGLNQRGGSLPLSQYDLRGEVTGNPHRLAGDRGHRFNQIDVTKATDQELTTMGQPGYNFDTFTTPDISYEIDVTKPLPQLGQKAQGASRTSPTRAPPSAPPRSFIVATNNYGPPARQFRASMAPT